MTRPSLYEFAGGAPALLALAAAHHARCLADPVLEHPFSHGTQPDHVQRLADYWSEAFGGPAAYTGGGDDQTFMLRIHAGQGMESDLGERFVRAFVEAIDDAGLPADPEFRAVLRAYMEWAVADVVSYSPPGSRVAEGLRVPRWSWDGLQESAST